MIYGLFVILFWCLFYGLLASGVVDLIHIIILIKHPIAAGRMLIKVALTFAGMFIGLILYYGFPWHPEPVFIITFVYTVTVIGLPRIINNLTIVKRLFRIVHHAPIHNTNK